MVAQAARGCERQTHGLLGRATTIKLCRVTRIILGSVTSVNLDQAIITKPCRIIKLGQVTAIQLGCVTTNLDRFTSIRQGQVTTTKLSRVTTVKLGRVTTIKPADQAQKVMRQPETPSVLFLNIDSFISGMISWRPLAGPRSPRRKM